MCYAMDVDDRPGGFELRFDDPFATPPEWRDQARRLRGRLAAPVTVWTAGEGARRAGLTVSSLVVAEGDPAVMIGVVSPTSELWDAIEATGAFVVHVLGEGERQLADRFSGARPGLGGPFGDLEVDQTPYGPVLASVQSRACCRLLDASPVGYQQLVRGSVGPLTLAEVTRPLLWYRGHYRRLGADPR
ncbi:MAG: flavin reductase [Acidimicrobiales bacterium]|nr:flavin reductase [Acidimicrobiales bacterium]